MKKPTKDDLERIRADLRQMQDYFIEIHNNRTLSDAESNVNYNLMEALDYVGHALFYIADLRENIVME